MASFLTFLACNCERVPESLLGKSLLGGTIGFYCAHQYAHTRDNTEKLMPYALKGIDVAIFAVFRALGLRVIVRPIIENGDIFIEWDEMQLENRSYDSELDECFEDEENEETQPVTRVGNRFLGLTLNSTQYEDENPDDVST